MAEAHISTAHLYDVRISKSSKQLTSGRRRWFDVRVTWHVCSGL